MLYTMLCRLRRLTGSAAGRSVAPLHTHHDTQKRRVFARKRTQKAHEQKLCSFAGGSLFREAQGLPSIAEKGGE